VVAPTAEESVPEGEPINFYLIVADAESAPTELALEVQVAGKTLAYGTPDKVGRYKVDLTVPAGAWDAVVRATDPGGLSAEVAFVLTVAPPDSSPLQRPAPRDDEPSGGPPTAVPETFVLFRGDPGLGRFGALLALTPDLDLDGRRDLLVGAPGREGGAVLLFAAASLEDADLVTPDLALARLVGEHDGDQLGAPGSAARVGDLDGDGLEALALGAPGNDDAGNDAGAVYVLRGGSPLGGTLPAAEAATWSVRGEPGDRFGSAVAGGDLDGDGLSDLLVGAPASELGGEGAGVVARFAGGDVGRRGAYDLSDTDALVVGDSGERLGSTIAVCPDANGDGYAELGLSDRGPTATGVAAGRFRYLSGPDVIAWTAAGDTAWLTLAGDRAGDALGAAFACPGDLDGDGLGDLFVGAPGADTAGPDAGAVVVLFGPGAGDLTLSARDADANFFGAPGDRFGDTLAAAGDVDGDGIGDLLLGAPGAAGSVALARGRRVEAWRPGGSPTDLSFTGNPATGRLGGALLGGFELDAATPAGIAIGAPDAADGLGAVFVLSAR
jgi:hypothetical protein